MSATGILERGGLLSGGGERDYNHVSDNEYKRLRGLADEAFSKKQKLAHQSQEAYKSGDGAKAKQLSEEAKKQTQIADDYNFQAAKYVFIENNADSDSNEIDLHGLYIKEAIYILKSRIAAGAQRNETILEVIVGKGIHSKNGVAKLKPAVEELCQEAGFQSRIDQKNTGVLIIDLKSGRVPNEWFQLPPINTPGPSKPSNAYLPQGQPQYQNNYQQNNNNFNQQQNHNNNNNNNDIGKLLLKVLCFCVKNFNK